MMTDWNGRRDRRRLRRFPLRGHNTGTNYR